jgi:hypothetical protein
VATGKVIGRCYQRHRSREFLKFLRAVDTEVPRDLDVHLVLDNYATHKTPAIRAWLARRPHWHVHLTPTSASWLNQVERFFAELTNQLGSRAWRAGRTSRGALANASKGRVGRWSHTFSTNSTASRHIADASGSATRMARIFRPRWCVGRLLGIDSAANPPVVTAADPLQRGPLACD